jgi:hypothetical protein
MLLPQLFIPAATRLVVRLTGGPAVHPTSGCRDWRGQFEAAEPIVALAFTISGTHVRWSRTSHRGTVSLNTRILFAPYTEAGLQTRVSFFILDAGTVSQTVVDSLQTEPSPRLQSFTTGDVVQIAVIGSHPVCELKALFLARRDVASVRNGVWHARENVVATLSEPWRKILTYGRSGEV